MTQEAQRWSGMTYPEFRSGWEDHRQYPPGQIDRGANLQSMGSAMVMQGAIATQLDTPAPGPADVVGIPWVAIGLCVSLVGAGYGGTITLPMRQNHPELPDEEECDEELIICENMCLNIHHGFPSEIRACMEECFLEYMRCLGLRPRFD